MVLEDGHIKPRILVVDDDHLIRRAHKLELGQEFEVIGVASYVEGLRLLSTDIDAVVSDSRMGAGPGGWALLDEARSRIPDVPRIMVSGALTRADADKVVVQGIAHEVLHKPYTRGELVAVVRRLLKKA